MNDQDKKILFVGISIIGIFIFHFLLGLITNDTDMVIVLVGCVVIFFFTFNLLPKND